MFACKGSPPLHSVKKAFQGEDSRDARSAAHFAVDSVRVCIVENRQAFLQRIDEMEGMIGGAQMGPRGSGARMTPPHRTDGFLVDRRAVATDTVPIEHYEGPDAQTCSWIYHEVAIYASMSKGETESKPGGGQVEIAPQTRVRKRVQVKNCMFRVENSEQ